MVYMKKLNRLLMFTFATLLILSNLMGSISAATKSVSTSNLEAYWNFNDGTGNVATDSAGSMAGRNLTVAKGSANWVAGKDGKAFYLDGNTVLSMSGAKQIKSTNITIGLWAKLDTMPASGDTSGMNQFVANEELAAIGKGAIDFGFQLGGLRSYVVNVFTQSTGDEVKTGLNNVNTYYNNWHYFTVVFNEDAANPYAKLYVDGNVVQESVLSSIPGLPIFLGYPKSSSYQKTNLDIGGYISTDGKVVRTIKGAIDDLRIYSRALSDNEVKLLASTASSSSTATNSSSSKSNASSKTTNTSSKTESISSALTSSTVSQEETISDSITSDTNNVSSTISITNSTPKETKPSNPIFWIISLIAVILVVAGAIFYIYYKKKSIK
jgi:hypothetical protein